MKRNLLVILSLFVFPMFPLASDFQYAERNWGIRFGLSFDLGTHSRRVGVFYTFYWTQDALQINQRSSFYFAGHQMGHGKKGPEWQLGVGALFNWGPQRIPTEFYIGLLENQSGRSNAAGYGVTWYFDRFGTSQSSGSVALHVQDFHFYTENDILTGTGNDRFRTGGVHVSYGMDSIRLGATLVHWTGDPKSDGVIEYNNSAYPSKSGYKDLSNGTYGTFSLGLFSIQADYAFDFGQAARINAGIDSERVRHLFQNKLMHEFISKGHHYPMLDAEGKPVTNPKDGDIKPLKPYFNLSGNPTLFY